MVSEQQMGESASAAYLEALAMAQTVPGTVCVQRHHYQASGNDGHFHEVPYQMGYHHGSPDHWHVSEREYLRCPDTRL